MLSMVASFAAMVSFWIVPIALNPEVPKINVLGYTIYIDLFLPGWKRDCDWGDFIANFGFLAIKTGADGEAGIGDDFFILLGGTPVSTFDLARLILSWIRLGVSSSVVVATS